MYRKHYQSGERMFIVDETRPEDGYYNIIDIESKVKFKLPISVINTKKYIFSWDRYKEELDIVQVRKSLEIELARLQKMKQTKNIILGIQYTTKFIKEL